MEKEAQFLTDIDFKTISAEQLLDVLAYRAKNIRYTIINCDDKAFRKYVSDHSELRRKIRTLFGSKSLSMMDYETRIIKHGRDVMAGKPCDINKI